MKKSSSAEVPEIAPVSGEAGRPYWSVMIPTYNPDELLEQTLRCVLDQDPGVERMQIAVVDDRSPNGRAREIVARLAPSRVEFHGQPINVGLAGNWNSCIAKSRGEWVHIFHQDDLVMPGFYEKLGRVGATRPDVGVAYCRHAFIDIDGDQTLVSDPESPTAGVVEDWADRIAGRQLVQCPSVVVKRAVYEQLGGYRRDLCYALDWEMWVRIAFRYPVWYEPEVLACYRQHERNETSRLAKMNAHLTDICKALSIMHEHAPKGRRGVVCRTRFRYEINLGWESFFRNDRARALACGATAIRLMPSNFEGWNLLRCAAVKPVPRAGG